MSYLRGVCGVTWRDRLTNVEVKEMWRQCRCDGGDLTIWRERRERLTKRVFRVDGDSFFYFFLSFYFFFVYLDDMEGWMERYSLLHFHVHHSAS